MNEIKTYNDLWQYICKNTEALNYTQYYVSNPNQVALAFWNGMITALECEGKISAEDALNIWNEITKNVRETI